jgi:hypothetical protein
MYKDTFNVNETKKLITLFSYRFSLCTLLDDKNEDLDSKGLPFFTISLRGLSNHHGKAAPEFLP